MKNPDPDRAALGMRAGKTGTFSSGRRVPAFWCRKNSRRWVVGFGMLGLALLANFPGEAFEARDLLAFKAGPVVIHTKLGVSEQYSDNITYTSGDLAIFPKEDDFITIINPGFEATLGDAQAGKVFTLGYSFSSLLYAQHSRFNATDHEINLSATFTGNRLKSTTSGHVGFLSTILNGQERFSQGILLPSGKVDRIPYGFSSQLAYSMSAKVDAYLRGSFDGTRYPDSRRFYNEDNWRVALGGTYAVGPKWRFLTEGYYGQTIYDSSSTFRRNRPNWDRLGGNIGFTTDVTERLSGTAKVGYEYWDRDVEDGSTFTANIRLNYYVGRRTSFSLDFSRSARQSVSVAGQSYIYYRGGLGVQYQWGTSKHPILLNAHVNGGFNDRDGGGETYAQAGVGASYMVKTWLRFLLAYQFESRNGNAYLMRNYTVNTITLTAVLGY